MHFSSSLLAAAGLLALTFAAPISQDVQEGAAVAAVPRDALSPTIVPRAVIAERATKSTTKTTKTKKSKTKKTTTSSTKKSSATSPSVKTTSSVKAVTTSKATSTKPASVAASSTPVSKTTSQVATSTPAAAKAVTAATTKGLQWLGVNESGAEFGAGNLPGTLGTDYTWPSTSAIKTLMDQGMNIFRIPFLMERLAQGSMTATLDATYLAALTNVVNFITAAGGHAVVDAQNFGRYKGAVFTSTSDFQTFWNHVATTFKSNDKVIFDCNNEFHDEPTATIVAELNQACINGIRAAGATTQYIFVEGTSYTGAWTWTTSGNSVNMGGLTDSSDKIIYEMHQYLDSDGSGTSETCVSSTIGAERIAAATTWLRANGKKGILGEFAGGANTVCQTAVTGLLDALVAGSDVWMGGMFWAAGPWWGDYIFSMEPSSGKGYNAYMSTLAKYAPS